jgi:serine protease
MHGNPNQQPGSTSPELAYRGGAVQSVPAAYLVYWGNQWASDPAGEATYLSTFLKGLNGSADTWSTSTTQYCQGVATGTTDCSKAATANTTMITHPATTNLLGTWADNTIAAPPRPKQSQFAAEAVRAAKNFGLQPGTQVQIVIATAHNNNATGFGTSYCAWHSSTSYGGSYLAYTNLPYIPDAGGACGANFVNRSGLLDGVSIVEGHEYAESVTDPFPNNGWLDQNGAENGDKCAWISSGQGAATNVSTATGTFPVQSLWSNNFNGTGGCVTFYQGASSQH